MTVKSFSRKISLLSEKEPFRTRSEFSFSKSIYAEALLPSNAKRSLSDKIAPFSAIVQSPENTRSVDDSPTPEEAYT